MNKNQSGVKEWEKLENKLAWQLKKVKNKKEVIGTARKEGKTAHFASSVDICYFKNSELESNFQKYNGRIVFRGDMVKMIQAQYSQSKVHPRHK